jgi:RND family efflux transporter MFP subunit
MSEARARCRAVLASVLLACACGHAQKEESRTEAAVPVETATARLGAIRGTIRATGIVNAAPGGLQAVTSPAGARIAAMPKAPGDPVHKGDLLVRFDAPSLTAEAAAKDAAALQATARLDNARKANERTTGLLERGIAARKELEDAERELRDAEAALQQAQAERTAAHAIAERAVVTAGFEGVVVDRNHNPGDIVDAGGDPLLRVVDPKRLQVDATVSATDIGRIRAGNAVHVRRGPEDDPGVAGRLDGVAAAVNASTGMAAVRVGLPRDSGLPLGLSVQIEIDAEQRANVIVVPAGAMVREGAATFVYVVGADKKARRQEVTAGVSSDTEVEVRSGIKAGDIVIVRGQQALPDGAEVAAAS